MKLSNAIMVGRTVIEYIDAHTFCGCAIGMGLAALGYKYTNIARGYGYERARESKKAFDDAIREWPWLQRTTIDQPSWWHCRYGHLIYDVISEGFNYVSDGIITLESLVAWIQTVEPEEDDNPTDRREQPVVEECQEVAAVNHS